MTRARKASRAFPISKRIRSCRLGLSQEFIGRSDGWPGLKRAYELPFADAARGLDHGLAYEAIAQRQIDVDRHLLDRRQDRQVRLARARRRPQLLPALRRGAAVSAPTLPQRLPQTWAALRRLEGRIDDTSMRTHECRSRARGQKTSSPWRREFLAEPSRRGVARRRPRRPRCTGARQRQAVVLAEALRTGFRAPDDSNICCSCSPRLRASIALGIPLGILAAAVRHGRPDPGRRASCKRSRRSPARVPDPADRTHRRVAGVHRVRALRIAAHRAKHAYRAAQIGRGMKRRHSRWGWKRNDPARHRIAARRADDHGGHQDIGGDQRRHGDDCRVHRCGRLWRAHRDRALR